MRTLQIFINTHTHTHTYFDSEDQIENNFTKMDELCGLSKVEES